MTPELTPTQRWFQRAMATKITREGTPAMCESLLQAVGQEGGVQGAWDTADRIFNIAGSVKTNQGYLVAGRAYLVLLAVHAAQCAIHRARTREFS